eukprot:GEMP01108694.1.p1 GENE.GEMP01108694.1~~GEMP01108694.1.p1  ORF type:complete len:129 (-),score=2.30 GEMP01108694.1:130-516(-)
MTLRLSRKREGGGGDGIEIKKKIHRCFDNRTKLSYTLKNAPHKEKMLIYILLNSTNLAGFSKTHRKIKKRTYYTVYRHGGNNRSGGDRAQISFFKLLLYNKKYSCVDQFFLSSMICLLLFLHTRIRFF